MSEREIAILHVFPSFAIGGQQRRLATLIEDLGPQFAHRIISLDAETGAEALLPDRRKNVSVIPMPITKSSSVGIGNIAALRRAIADSAADLLCTYNFGSIEAVIANALGPRLPHVHHEDGFGADESHGRRKRRRALARRLLLSRAIVAVPSHELEGIARAEWGLQRGRVRRIPPGVDLARFSRSARETAGPVVVGALGALRAEKNFARLIRCFVAASRGRDARLAIVGEGPQRAALAKLAGESQARAKISFPGATAKPEEALAGFDIFALSSDTEQTPLSLMEAMAAGLPAVATDVGDVAAMMGEAVADFVFPPEDEAAFAAALGELIDDADLRRRAGAANAERAQTFDKNSMITAFRALYREAAGAEG